MTIHISKPWLVSSGVTLLLLVLLWLVNTTLAAGEVGSQISYQGTLLEDGQPVTGTRNMVFRLYTEAGCGSGQVGSDISQPNVPVNNGFFSVTLSVNQADFNGQALWLEVAVAGTTISCQPILPAPYALSLRPRAIIEGVSGLPDFGSAVLNIKDNGGLRALYSQTSSGNAGFFQNNGGTSLHGLTFSTNPDDAAVWGENKFYGYGGYFYSLAGTGVHGSSSNGIGIYGVSSATAKAGIFGEHTGTGNAGFFQSANGTAFHAQTQSTNSSDAGVWGKNFSNGYGGYFYSQNGTGLHGASTGGIGIYGVSSASGQPGIRAENSNAASPDLALGGGTGVLNVQDTNGADLLIRTNDEIILLLDADGNETSRFRIDTDTANVEADTVFEVDQNGNVYADGTYLGAGGVTTTCAPNCADFAETMDADTAAATYEPGDVLVVDDEGLITLSRRPYAASVVGIYSTRPAFLARAGQTDNQVPVALVGTVPVKVSAENGPIQPGDLLTTASLPGHAMRCVGVERCFGRTIGKALAGLAEGTGVINVLVMLQ